jgi:MFS family permease
MFGIFLFLTYYMELDLGFTPFLTGIAFLPLTLSIIIGSTFVGGRLLPRVGPKPLVFAGGLAAAIGMLLLARIDIHSNYLVVVLPALVIMGVGLGTAFSAAIATSTSGVQPDDAGVASATVNTAQQVGGSIGTALLSTLSANAILTFVSAHGASGGTHGVAIVFGYQVVFWTSAVVFACAAVCGGILLRARPKLPGARPRFEVAPAPMVAAHCAIILTHVRN